MRSIAASFLVSECLMAVYSFGMRSFFGHNWLVDPARPVTTMRFLMMALVLSRRITSEESRCLVSSDLVHHQMFSLPSRQNMRHQRLLVEGEPWSHFVCTTFQLLSQIVNFEVEAESTNVVHERLHWWRLNRLEAIAKPQDALGF